MNNGHSDADEPDDQEWDEDPKEELIDRIVEMIRETDHIVVLCISITEGGYGVDYDSTTSLPNDLAMAEHLENYARGIRQRIAESN